MGGSPRRASHRDEKRSAAQVGAEARVRPKPTALLPGGKMEFGTISSSSSISVRGSTPPAIEISAPTGLTPASYHCLLRTWHGIYSPARSFWGAV